MRRFHGRFQGLALTPSGQPAIQLSCEPENLPLPGQGILAYKPGSQAALRRLLFPVEIFDNGFLSDCPTDPMWTLGDSLDLIGPLGTGFSPPTKADHWLLIKLTPYPDRLLPLIDIGLERGVTISLWSRHIPHGLSPQVELNPDIQDALKWAEYLAMDLKMEEQADVGDLLGILKGINISIPGQVLLATEMPCGVGACQACAFHGKQGWMLTCSDGPIFDFKQLEW